MDSTVLRDSLSLFGVVPVFVNTGAALLPALLAGVASVLGLLFRPRELVRLCVRRPWLPLLVAGLGAGGYFLIGWLVNAAPATAADGPASASPDLRRRQGAEVRGDWAAVALELIRQEERDWRKAWLEERSQRLALEKRVAELEKQLQEQAAGSGATGTADVAATPRIAQAPRHGTQAPPQFAQAPETTAPREAAIYRGGPARCGYAGGGSPLGLRPFWEYNEAFTMYLASPLVVGDAVYAASCVLDPPGNYGAVFCLDAATGQQRWYTDAFRDPQTGREQEMKAFFSSPALTADGKHLVIGQGLHLDKDCQLVCLDAQTGAVRWVVPTPLHIESSPAIEDDIVVAGAGAVEGEDLKPKGDPGFVFAVRISDGKLLWKYPVNDPESSPVVRDGVAYIGSGLNGSAVVALRTAEDEELAAAGVERLVWKTPTPYPAVGAVTLIGELVLIGCGNANYVFSSPDPKGAVVALDRATGRIRWQTDVGNSVLGAIAARGSKAVVAVLDGQVVALDLQQGDVLWRRRVREHALLKAGPALSETHVYVVTHDGNLCVLDAASGELVEQHYLNLPEKPGEMGLSTSSPFVAGGRVFVGSETGGLRCFAGEEMR